MYYLRELAQGDKKVTWKEKIRKFLFAKKEPPLRNWIPGPSQALRRPFAGNPAQNIFFWRRPVSCSRELMMLQWWTWLQPKYSNRGTYSTLAFCIEIWWKLDELRYVNMPNMKDNCSDFHRKINLHLLNDIAFITYPTLAFCIEIWMKIKWNMLP